MRTTIQPLDATDQALLAAVQKQVPIDHRPFEFLGERLGLSEQECLDRIGRLKSRGIILKLSAALDGRALGYQQTLAAMKVDPSRVSGAVSALTLHPGVWYCDQRHDPFNLWLALAAPPSDSLEQTLKVLHVLAGASETILLPALSVYKQSGRDAEEADLPAEALATSPDDEQRVMPKPPFTEQDLRRLRLIQADLPLIELPFAVWAEQLDTTEDELFAWLKRAEHAGYLLRFAAAVHLRAPGPFTHTRVVWQPDEAAVDATARSMIQFREVTDCYRHPIYSSWQHALFTIIRAESDAACLDVVQRIEQRIGATPHKHLFTLKVYKRASVKFFDPALETWWSETGSKVHIDE